VAWLKSQAIFLLIMILDFIVMRAWWIRTNANEEGHQAGLSLGGLIYRKNWIRKFHGAAGGTYLARSRFSNLN
jgi:hypothetical protein